MSFERLNALFDRACEVPAPERRALLQQECPDEPALVDEVLALLAAYDDLPERFLSLGAEVVTDDGHPGVAKDRLPPRIGPYRVVGELGRGGMGVVYEAMQLQPARRVAVKVVRGRFAAEELHQRFSREARVLGHLQHPGIAHIYEAGSADVGGEQWPYFAMELVRGRPLDAHLDAIGASLEDRLTLLAEVCDAVEHAHQRGVVHRDLKPSNILVTASEEHRLGRPKILDFGIARVMGVDANDATLQTKTGEIVGTLGYMSPEQISGDLERVDARSDVYALGVILYVLASGRLPYDLRGKSLPEVARMVADDDATRLSSIDRRLAGDVETIVSKALERDPDRRYASAAALAHDLRAFLGDRPIVARPPTARYRAIKFVRRHKGLVGGLTATFVALLAGLLVSTVALVRATRDRETSEAVTAFLVGMVGAASPERQGRDVTMRDVLKASESDIDRRFDQQPRVRARLHETLGRAYVELGDFERALAHAAPALETWEAEVGPDDLRTLGARTALATTHFFRGEYEDARAEMQTVIDRYRRVLPPQAPELAVALSRLGQFETKLLRFDRAEAALVEARAIFAARGAADTRDGLEADARLAHVYAYLRRDTEAEALQKSVIERTRRLLGPEHPDTIQASVDLAVDYNLAARGVDVAGTDKSREVIRLLAEAHTLQVKVLGEGHASTLATLNQLAEAYWRAREDARAIELTRQGWAAAEAAYGERSPTALDLRVMLAQYLLATEKFDEAEALMVPGYQVYEAVYGETDRPALTAHEVVIHIYLGKKEYAEAARHGDVLLARYRTLPWLPPYAQWDLRTVVARAYEGVERFDEAEALLLEADKILPDAPKWFDGAVLKFYERRGWADKAEAWRQRMKTTTATTG